MYIYNAYVYYPHTYTHLQWCINLPWYLRLPFTLESSWNSAGIIFQKGWTRERREQYISSCLLPPQVSITPSSHFLSTSLLTNLIIWSQCTSANNKFEWSEFQNQKSIKNLSKRGKLCEVVLWIFSALPTTIYQLCYLGLGENEETSLCLGNSAAYT